MTANNIRELNINNADVENAQGPLASLHAGTHTVKLTYPNDFVDTEEHFIRFMPVTYSRANRNVSAIKTTNAIITLPIPGNLAVAYSANWGDQELGQIGNALASSSVARGALKAAIKGDAGAAIKGAVNAIRQDGGKLLRAGKTTVVRDIIQGIGDATGIKAMEAAQIALGASINPHLAVLFESIGFRTHSFTYKFTARSREESRILHDIVQTFKYCMHPGMSVAGFESGTVYSFPDEWIIKFSRGVRRYLYDFTPCVLTSFNVTYNGQGIPVFYDDTNAPIDVGLSFSFKEVEILTREKLRDEYQKSGFGHAVQEIKPQDQ